MQTLNLIQGSKEWKEVRGKYLVASEAPIIMGDSLHIRRDELLRMKTTGDEQEITRWTQKIFDKGHAVEGLARGIIEDAFGEELYPVIGVREVDGLPLFASLDGAPINHSWVWECKQFNKALVDIIKNDEELKGSHYWQLEHQLLVTGAEYALFTVSDGTPVNTFSMKYYSRPERREQLIEGWKLFLQDLQSYEAPEAIIEPVGRAPSDLAVLDVKVSGSVLSSNLDAFKANALDVIENISTELETDQDFADAEKTVKWCQTVEEKLALTEDQVLSQAADINHVIKTIGELKNLTRDKRLELTKLVKKRKDAIRSEIALNAKNQWADYVAELQKTLSPLSVPVINIDIPGAIKGKRTIETLRSAANDELARAKIEASRLSNKLLASFKAYQACVGNYGYLFSDLNDLCQKDEESVKAIVKTRIEEHKQAEEDRRAQQEAAKKAAEAVKPLEQSEPMPTNIRQAVDQAPASQSVIKRPSDAQIIAALSHAFSVSESTAIQWLLEIDLGEQQKLTANN